MILYARLKMWEVTLLFSPALLTLGLLIKSIRPLLQLHWGRWGSRCQKPAGPGVFVTDAFHQCAGQKVRGHIPVWSLCEMNSMSTFNMVSAVIIVISCNTHIQTERPHSHARISALTTHLPRSPSIPLVKRTRGIPSDVWQPRAMMSSPRRHGRQWADTHKCARHLTRAGASLPL